MACCEVTDERQRFIIGVKEVMFNCCFMWLRVDISRVSRFGRCGMRKMMAGCRIMLHMNYGFLHLK